MTFMHGTWIGLSLWLIALVIANWRWRVWPWLCGAAFFVATAFTVCFAVATAWQTMPSRTVEWQQWLAFVGAPFVALGILYRLLAGRFNDNLKIEVTARSIGDGKALITLAVEKGDSGSIRLLDVVALAKRQESRPVLEELRQRKGSLETRVAKETLVLSPGDRAQLSWTIKATENEIVEIAILGRKHPFQTFFHHPQWRSSCVVTARVP